MTDTAAVALSKTPCAQKPQQRNSATCMGDGKTEGDEEYWRPLILAAHKDRHSTQYPPHL